VGLGSSPRQRRSGWLFALVAIAGATVGACARSQPAPLALAAGAPLPRFCAADECAVIVDHNAEIESCECAARQFDETLGARLDLVFAVPAGGGKAQVAVGRAIGSPDSLQRCVVDRAATWTFPAPAGGATRFRTGIIFTPDDHGACPPGPNATVRRATASKERLRTALAARQEEVKACYNGQTPGRIVITLIFNRDGRVIQAQIDEAAVHDERVEACITDKAYAWPLPKPTPPGVVSVSYPYSFATDTP
jgi:hypothetical protein